MREDACRPCDCSIDAVEICSCIRHEDVTNALSGERKRLAVRITDNRIVVKVGDARHCRLDIDNLAIRLIRNDEDCMPVFLFFPPQKIC